MKKNIDGISEYSCSGCGTCSVVCPKKCISMIENNRGFLIPSISKDECIDCGVCLSRCPELTTINLNVNIKTFAASTKNKDILIESTSGGVFYELASAVLKENGIVCGCSWCFGVAKHICIDKLDDLNKIQKSKYVQSEMGNIYSEIKGYISKGKQILFCGTACQIAGLCNFLNNQTDSLITVEVVCHGVPSPGLYKKYITWLENKYNKKIDVYNFRTKKFHKKGEHFKSFIIFNDKTESSLFMNTDPYYSSFINGKTLRKTCYKCKYKGKNRVSDITVCDFWGIEKEIPNFPSNFGASAVLVNSVKGIDLFDKIKENLNFTETTIDIVAKSNPSLYNSTKECNELNYSLKDKDVIEKMIPKYTVKMFIKNHFPEKFKYFLKKYL